MCHESDCICKITYHSSFYVVHWICGARTRAAVPVLINKTWLITSHQMCRSLWAMWAAKWMFFLWGKSISNSIKGPEQTLLNSLMWQLWEVITCVLSGLVNHVSPFTFTYVLILVLTSVSELSNSIKWKKKKNNPCLILLIFPLIFQWLSLPH